MRQGEVVLGCGPLMDTLAAKTDPDPVLGTDPHTDTDSSGTLPLAQQHFCSAGEGFLSGDIVGTQVLSMEALGEREVSWFQGG